LFYGPRFSKVAADAKPNSGRSDYDARIRQRVGVMGVQLPTSD
jgi:hypothetical protein